MFTLVIFYAKLSFMKLFNSKIHGIIDYLLVFMLSISPFIFDLEEDSIHCRLLMVTGLLLLLTSLLTDFEFFLVKIFSFKMHLVIDFLLGVFLATSPIFFDLKGHSIIPHIVLGIVIIGVTFITKTTAEPAKVEQEIQNDMIIQE